MSFIDYNYRRASSSDELHQILKLQKLNSKAVLTESDQTTEGFITVIHDFNILKKLNDFCSHIIVKDGRQVVGYALVMTREFKNDIEVLAPMFDSADELLGDKKFALLESTFKCRLQNN